MTVSSMSKSMSMSSVPPGRGPGLAPGVPGVMDGMESALSAFLDVRAREAILNDLAVLPGDDGCARCVEFAELLDLAGLELGIADEHQCLAIGAQGKDYTISGPCIDVSSSSSFRRSGRRSGQPSLSRELRRVSSVSHWRSGRSIARSEMVRWSISISRGSLNATSASTRSNT